MMVWLELLIDQELLLLVVVANMILPVSPDTVVVLLKLGLALVIVTAPVAPLRVMPDPATAEVTTGV